MPLNRDRILYQDDSLLAVAKLSGELSVRGKGELGKLPLFDFLKKEFPGIHPINRLDFETSGVMLFARTKAVLATVVEQGTEQWEKTYVTIVKGRMDRREGIIRTPLPARSDEALVPAETRYRVLDQFPVAAYVEALITTGRHHQIRKHFAKIGHPLVLDHLYGDEKFNRAFSREYRYHRFFLHARSVTFTHPVAGSTVSIEAPLPRSFEEALKKLRA